MSKKKTLLFYIIIIILAFNKLSFSNRFSDLLFLELKAKDKIKEAFAVASHEIAHTDSQAKAEIWLFRVKEILRYPELFTDAIDMLVSAINKNSTLARSSRAKLLLLELYLSQGNLQKVQQLSSQLGFLNEFLISAPIKIAHINDLENTLNVEREFSVQSCKKENFFLIATDHSGKITISHLYPSVFGNAFLFYTEISILNDTACTLHIGKNCPMVVSLSREKVFSDLTEHEFEYDQFQIRMKLKAGTYPLIIKTFGTKAGCTFAIRITDHQGNPLIVKHKSSSLKLQKPQDIHHTFFDALKAMQSYADDEIWHAFHTGYLLYAAKLVSKERTEAVQYFSKVYNDKLLSPYANFYLSLCANEISHKEHFLRKSINQKNDFLEALSHISDLYIDNKLYYETDKLIKAMYAINPSSPLAAIQHGNLCLAQKWYFEAQKIGEKLLSSHFPSAGHQLLAKVFAENKHFHSTLMHYEKLFSLNKTDRFSILKAADSLNSIGKYFEAENILISSINLLKNDIELYLKTADTVQKNYYAGASLPYLSSAYAISPHNEKILLFLAETYHKLGKDDIAKYYFTEAFEKNTKNLFINQYLSFLDPSKSYNDTSFSETPLEELIAESKKYMHEPAVVLSDNTTYNVFYDGTKEKHVHLIYKIHSYNAIKDLSHHAIILNPAYETLEKILCTVTNNAKRVETSETKIQSISDPESRLYYDAIAHILTVPSLREGSLVDISYTIKTKGIDEFKGAFGFVNTIGGKHRVLHSKTTILFPKDKKLNVVIKNHSTTPTIEQQSNKKSYTVYLKNIEPLYDEPYMPPSFEILPTIITSVFTEWNELYKWYWNLLKGRDIPSERMRRDLAQILSPSDTSLEKIRKIYNLVTSRIRYVGFEFGIGNIQPRPVAETYASGMGDCKDIALLIVSLLRIAGIDARFALIRTSDHGEIDLSLPWIGLFNHAICYVNIGEELFLDGTASFADFREIPENASGVKAFILNEHGYIFREVQSSLFEPNLLEITNTVSINPDGSAHINRHLIKRGGLFAPSARYSLQHIPSMVKKLNEYWNKEYPNSIIKNLTIINKSTDQPVNYAYTIIIPDFCQLFNNLISFKSILIPSEEFQTLTLQKKRRYNLNINTPHTIRETTVFNIPKDYKAIKLPTNKNYENETISINFSLIENRSSDTITVTHITKLTQNKINATAYNDFRKILLLNAQLQNEKIILQKK
ncbi:MAG: DUF3857 domain-containing protein [Spirochaetes bacterium]|nr:DUF3857 domain-containing protein [Spirochaetota bacterium]